MNIGSQYQFSFYTGQRGNESPNTQITVSVTSTGSSIGDLLNESIDIESDVGTWAFNTFTATTSTIDILFRETSLNSDSVGPAIDTASITQVIEPSSLILLCFGLLGLLGGRTRINQS